MGVWAQLLLRPQGLLRARLLCPWDFPGKNEYWSGLPFPSPGDLLSPGIEPESPALAGRFFTTEPPGQPNAGYNLSHMLELFWTYLNPHQMVEFKCMLTTSTKSPEDWLEPEGWWCWPSITPSPTNQRIVYQLMMHSTILFLTLSLETFPGKPSGRSKPFEH